MKMLTNLLSGEALSMALQRFTSLPCPHMVERERNPLLIRLPIHHGSRHL